MKFEAHAVLKSEADRAFINANRALAAIAAYEYFMKLGFGSIMSAEAARDPHRIYETLSDDEKKEVNRIYEKQYITPAL